jgi:dolichyl-phosphate-mannose--protein O-mannosyl transferase
MIRFNVEMIKQLNYKEIYIICHSGKRSQFIKNKYFTNNNNIFVSESLQFQKLTFGINNNITLNNNYTIDVNVIGSNSFNIYSIMRITQIILGTLILIIGLYTLNKINSSSIPLIILLFFGFNALINGLTSTCTISDIFVDYLN